VVRDSGYALGLQVLNIETLGGALINDEGSDPSRSSVAQARPWGSVLQAYALDRSRPRSVGGWNGQFPDMPVEPIPGETVVGSAIALFGCPAGRALERIGAIEAAEGLPHPTIDGEWVKTWRDLGRSYLIAVHRGDRRRVARVHEARGPDVAVPPRALRELGALRLDPKAFPGGNAGMRRIVERARDQGIRIGVHTLDELHQHERPVCLAAPRPTAGRTGSSALAADVSASATEIPVASPEYFANDKANWLHTVVIGDELVRYRAVSRRRRGRCSTASAARSARRPRPTRRAAAWASSSITRTRCSTRTSRCRTRSRSGSRRSQRHGRRPHGLRRPRRMPGPGQGDYGLERFAKVFFDNLKGR